jgi:hypothetical protein
MEFKFPCFHHIVLLLIGIPLAWLVVWFLIILLAHLADLPKSRVILSSMRKKAIQNSTVYNNGKNR